jgi:hypothetical protein
MRRPILLLELLIAIALSAILMTSLFRLFVSNATLEKKLGSAHELLAKRTHLIDRLETLFSHLEPPFLYTASLSDDGESLSLIASFDAGVDPEPNFSSSNLARIHLQRSGKLSFTQWPLEAPFFRSEILLRDVDRVEWSFYQEGKWVHHWSQENKGAPPLIRLAIWEKVSDPKKEPSIELAFVLPAQERLILK